MSDKIVDSKDWSAEDDKEAEEMRQAMLSATTDGEIPAAVTEIKPEATPAAAEVTETPAATEQPAVSDEAAKKEQLAAEIAELQKRKRDLAGEVGGELDRRARQQTAELQASLQQAQAELAALKAAQRPAVADIGDDVLFNGLDDTQKDPNDPVVQMTAKMTRNAMAFLAKQTREENERREQEFKTQMAQTQLDRFTESVESVEPGFKKVNGYGGGQTDPEWSDHLSAKRPGMSVTWRQYVSLSDSPAEAAAEAFRALKEKKAGAAPVAKKVVGDASAQVAPQKSTTSPKVVSTESESGEAKMLRLARDYNAGRLSEEEFEKQTKPLLQSRGMLPE